MAPHPSNMQLWEKNQTGDLCLEYVLSGAIRRQTDFKILFADKRQILPLLTIDVENGEQSLGFGPLLFTAEIKVLSLKLSLSQGSEEREGE